MHKTLFSVILFFTTAFLYSQDITGTWEGLIKTGNTRLRLVFHIERNDTSFTTTMDSPDQGAFGLPTSRTTFNENKLEIVASGLGLFYRGLWERDSMKGTFNQGGIPFPLILKRPGMPLYSRPQTPTAPLPYMSEEVIIPQKKDSLFLSGTFTLPDGKGVFPAVVLIAGSGPNDRDETLFGHKPFLVISDFLTRQGFAVLRYDKRGVGKSTGDYSKATIRDFAEDAKAVVEYLRQRKEIHSSHIGLLGHSEGAIVAPMVAANSNTVHFMVLMAGPGTKGIDVIMDQNENAMKTQGMEPETMVKLQQINREMFESLLTWDGSESHRTALRDKLSYLWEQLPILTKLKVKKEPYLRSQFNALITPWYRSFLATDPAVYLEKVSCPVLAINGEKDTQVPAEKNLTAIKKALEKGKNFRNKTQIYPGLNHLFQESITGQTDEYAKSEQTISPLVLTDITNWMKRQAE